MNNTTDSTPPSSANGLNSDQKLCVMCGGSPATGMPIHMFAKPMPSTSETMNEPMVEVQSKVSRQLSSGISARYSKETPRMIRPSSTSNNGR